MQGPVKVHRYEPGWGLKVGFPRDQVVSQLDDRFVSVRRPVLRPWMPVVERRCDSAMCTYEYTEEEGYRSHACFSFKDGCVNRVDWVYWVD